MLIDLPMNIQRSEVENPVYDMTFEDKHTDAAAAQQEFDGEELVDIDEDEDEDDFIELDEALEDNDEE